MDFLSTLKQLRLVLFEIFYEYIRLFLPSFIELVEAHPTCWITRMLHEWPAIWFTVTNNCYFCLRAPQDVLNSFDELCVVIRNQSDGDADKVLDYFKNTNIGRFRRNAKLKGMPICENNIFCNVFLSNILCEKRLHSLLHNVQLNPYFSSI